MAEVTVNLALVSGKVVDSQAPTSRTDFYNGSSDSYISLKNYPSYNNISRAYAKYNALSETYKYKKLISAQLYFYASTNRFNVAAYALSQDVDLSAINWNNAPALPDEAIGTAPAYLAAQFYLPIRTNALEAMSAAELSKAGKALLNAKTIALATVEAETATTLYTIRNGANSHYLRVIVDPDVTITSQVEAVNSPTSGYVNPRVANSFSWNLVSSDSVYTCAGEFVQQSATFYWRVKNASSWNSVSAGTSKSKTISANTFPTASTIQWYVSATDTTGTTSTTPTYEFSTAAGAVTATPVSPADSVEDNSAAITFTWNVTSADGQAHSSSELQKSTDGSTWSTLGTVSGSGTSYVCPTNTLPSGTIYWRVRASNIDGTAGAWSSAVTFISFGAPAAPSVTVTARNFATVNWQTDVQEAYKITVDGAVIGPIFGTERTYDLPEPLRAGTHTVSVEVQNSFGLWSQPGTANVTVTEGIDYLTRIVSVKGKIDAVITYNVDPRYTAVSAIYLYRDGIKIASLPVQLSNGQTYVDRFVLGRHSYQIIVRYTSGFGSFTDTVSTEITSCGAPRIAPFSGGEWMKLRLSETTRRTEGFSRQRQISLRHFTGAEYPVAEVSPYTDASGSYDCAFENVDDANAFEALFGQVVILKTKAENVVIGVLSGYEKQVNRHYIAYTFTIQRIYWRDYLDLTTD